MAVSPIIKAFQIFSGLGAVAVTPFTPSFFRKIEEIRVPWGGRQVNDDYREEPAVKEQSNSKNIMHEAVKIIESKDGNKEGEKRCFWLFSKTKWSELFICFNTTKLNSLTLFHYTWRGQELNEVTEINYKGASSLKMKFANQKTKDIPYYLRASFAWLRRGRNASLIPETHCSIKPIDRSRNYQLTCQVGDGRHTETVSPELPNKT